MSMKQVIIIRSDIKMSKGKTAAQACHASVSAALKSQKEVLRKWESEGQKKVILKARSLQELLDLNEKCKKNELTHCVISDAGLTELSPGTVTALGIGPDDEKKIDKVSGSLALLK
jgi:peptidyl-tRNA hydrolase, PTH2 family